MAYSLTDWVIAAVIVWLCKKFIFNNKIFCPAPATVMDGRSSSPTGPCDSRSQNVGSSNMQNRPEKTRDYHELIRRVSLNTNFLRLKCSNCSSALLKLSLNMLGLNLWIHLQVCNLLLTTKTDYKVRAEIAAELKLLVEENANCKREFVQQIKCIVIRKLKKNLKSVVNILFVCRYICQCTNVPEQTPSEVKTGVSRSADSTDLYRVNEGTFG